ncbi:hypothetical protein [Reyranella sp.]|uniref:hypothetical protein n=1 Tax=Reyranella sp. TaxID=1929291 RepID=UPI003D12A820
MGKIKRRTSGDPTFPLQEKSVPDGRTDFVLAHVTPVGRAREIIRSGKIETRHCDIFGRSLNYFFALRPAYRRKDSGEQSDQLDRFPFVFLLSSNHLPPPHQIYPFDTGGAIDGAFDEKANEYVFLEDYRLGPTYEAISGHIQWAFGSRENYYDGTLQLGLENSLPFHETAALSYLNIAGLATIGSNKPDYRASALEVSFDRHIPITGNVNFIILPRQFLEDPRGDNDQMIRSLKDANIAWDFYEWEPNRAPDEFRREINSLVKARLIAIGQL